MVWIVLAVALLVLGWRDDPVPVGRPLVVAGDVRVEPGRHVRPPLGADGLGGVITVTGVRGATIDLTGVELFGLGPGADPDQARGWGLVLRDCDDVTVRGGTLGGYKACLVAERCRGLVIEDVRFEGWFAQRLLSTPAAENPADWLWPHDNDEGEWIERYGGAISLTDCEGAVIRRCRGRRGQNGILMTRTNGSQVYDNDFSFLSGWGLAMYRASDNVVCRNVFDYCVRGYSHGVYWRGQDSAAILLFERCCDNVIALNSGTHSGDGLFLFAGLDSVEGRAFARGETDVGGSDRNLIWKNDFSYAVANAVEMTFSRDNRVIENLARGSHQHGVWGGYSSRALIFGNDFSGTKGGGVTIEHGQECRVEGNRFAECEIGVELYWDEDPQLVDGPYGASFDTASRDHWIVGNTFAGNGVDLWIERSTGIALADNVPPLAQLSLRGTTRDELATLEQGGVWVAERRRSRLPGRDLPGAKVAFDHESDDGRGLETIVVGEWGPFDLHSGEPRPEPRPPGGLLAGATWTATWFSWAAGPDPRDDLEDWRDLAASAAIELEVAAGGWGDPFAGRDDVRAAAGADRFGLVASATVEVEGGRHRLAVTSDDGVRVLVDGRPVLENWTWHAPTVDVVELDLAAGRRQIDVEYFQIDGATALALELTR